MKQALLGAGAAYWLRNARAAGVLVPGFVGEADADGLVRLDLRIEYGVIVGVAALGTAPEGVDLRGGQVWPGFIDAHTHLDKGHIWPRARNPSGDFAGAIGAVMADRSTAWSEADVAARADFALRCAYAHGTVAIRTHLDTYMPHGVGTWRAFRRLRDEWAGRITLQMSSISPLDRFAGPDGREEPTQRHAVAAFWKPEGDMAGMIDLMQSQKPFRGPPRPRPERAGQGKGANGQSIQQFNHRE